MAVFKLRDNVFNVGALHWDRRVFDEITFLPHGTTYNSYLILGDKVALIDTVDPSVEDQLMENLKSLSVERIDYIISSHAEQDHSGLIPKILDLYPEAVVVTNSKCKELLKDHLHLDDKRFLVVGEGDRLELGDKTLEFIMTPWVHWPETMSTYLIEDKIMFTCDFFGSHLATTKMLTEGSPLVLREAKRYYAEIMMPFSRQIEKNIEKLSKYRIDIIAPSHGPAYANPSFIIEAYKKWLHDYENKVLLIFTSMHGSTHRMAMKLLDLLVERGIDVELFNLGVSDPGEIAISLVEAPTLVIANPMFLGSVHPQTMNILYLINSLRPKVRYVGIIGSYGWGGRMIDDIKRTLKNLKTEYFEPVVVKGLPTSSDIESLVKLADEILTKHKEMKLLD